MVAAGLMFESIAASCSSPQTTELNAGRRAKTLMKWVAIGIAQGAVLIIVAAIYEPRRAAPMLLGGTLAGTLLGAQYVHARSAGLSSTLEGTEE